MNPPALKLPRPTPLAWTAYAIASGIIVLDQVSKAWVLYGVHLPEKGRLELSPIFDLTMVWNEGMSFGLLRAQGDIGRWALSAFAIGVALALAWWVRNTGERLFAAAAGLLMGGALGNMIDRMRFGAVVDFLDFSGLGFFPWIFNVADSAITIGAVLLLIEAFLPSLRSLLASRPENGN